MLNYDFNPAHANSVTLGHISPRLLLLGSARCAPAERCARSPAVMSLQLILFMKKYVVIEGFIYLRLFFCASFVFLVCSSR